MEPVKKHKLIRIVFASIIFVAFIWMLQPFITPLLMACLFSFALEPTLSKHSLKTSKHRLPTSLLLFGFFIAITAPIVLIGVRLTQKIQELSTSGVQNTPFFKSLSKIYESLKTNFAHLAEKAHLDLNTLSDPNDVAAKAGKILVGFTTSAVTNAPDLILDFFIFACAFYFFTTEARSIRKAIGRMNVLSAKEIDRIIEVIQKSSYSTLITTTVIGGLQALIVSIAALLFGYHEFLIIFMITFFTSFIPVIGAGPVAFVLSVFSFVLGETGAGIGLLIASVIAGSVDNLIKPLLVGSSEEVNVHPVIALVTVIGGVIAYGIPGLLLGPILTALIILVFPLLFENADRDV